MPINEPINEPINDVPLKDEDQVFRPRADEFLRALHGDGGRFLDSGSVAAEANALDFTNR